MNSELIVSLLENLGSIDPPGCVSEFVEHPYPPSRKSQCVEVGFVMEHRFAFHYWIKCKQKLQRHRHTSEPIEDAHFTPPDLVTWDWHDDCGVDTDLLEDKLKELDHTDEAELALYSWAGLCSLNDGQILPAVWLNALGNVYIIQKQEQDCKSKNRTLIDRFGNQHRVFYFRSLKHFPKTFEKTSTDNGVIWDIDLDYFTRGRRVPDQSSMPALSGEEVTTMLSPTAPWMPLILRDLKAITIALEPKFTGGLSISLELYRHWESSLFTAPLFSKKCRWRRGLLT